VFPYPQPVADWGHSTGAGCPNDACSRFFLAEREYNVEELTKLTGSGQSNLSQHLAALRQQKLVVPRRAGMNVYYALSNPRVADACKLIRRIMVELSEEEHRVVKKVEV
jgi:ArsR family transcriptional regulator